MLSTDLNEPVQFSSREQASIIALELIQSAKREICFFGSNIDHTLFDNKEAIEALSIFARSNHRATIHFLVHSTIENTRNNHRFIQLSQRLTSNVHIHTTDIAHKNDKDMFLLIDDTGYAHLKIHHFYQGHASLDNAVMVKKLKQRFEEMWNKSGVDVNVRRLHL